MLKRVKTLGFWDLMRNSYLFSENWAKSDKEWLLVKKIYEVNYLNRIDKNFENFKIPKRMHQIWLGGELPNQYKKWRDTWKKLHPDWEYRLWTDKDADVFKMINRDAFDLAGNLGSKSDIFRLEILHKYGGIYVDTDFECLKPFGPICKITNLFAGLAYSKNVEIYNGLIGASKENPIIKAYMMRIKKIFGDKKNCSNSNEVMERTGPYSFTKTCLEHIKKRNTDSIFFPVTFFYPFPNNERFKRDDKQIIKSYIKPESFAVHYWSTSWIGEQNLWGKLSTLIRGL